MRSPWPTRPPPRALACQICSGGPHRTPPGSHPGTQQRTHPRQAVEPLLSRAAGSGLHTVAQQQHGCRMAALLQRPARSKVAWSWSRQPPLTRTCGRPRQVSACEPPIAWQRAGKHGSSTCACAPVRPQRLTTACCRAGRSPAARSPRCGKAAEQVTQSSVPDEASRHSEPDTCASPFSQQGSGSELGRSGAGQAGAGHQQRQPRSALQHWGVSLQEMLRKRARIAGVLLLHVHLLTPPVRQHT